MLSEPFFWKTKGSGMTSWLIYWKSRGIKRPRNFFFFSPLLIYKRRSVEYVIRSNCWVWKFYKRLVLCKIERRVNFVWNVFTKNAFYARYSRKSEFWSLRTLVGVLAPPESLWTFSTSIGRSFLSFSKNKRFDNLYIQNCWSFFCI